jgi:3-deoxy-D-manno-octulosonic-acid transferase
MKKIWFLFYNFVFIPILFIGILIGRLFNEKMRRGIKGRKRIFEEFILKSALLDKSRKLIWFHSSSLGEFEQAKPIIEELKKNKNVNILVTFFSPSGYENSRKYPYADLISYIPFDTVSKARRFISIARPDLAILMRYDIWPNHVWAAKDAGIPSFIVDATMKDKSPRTFPVIKNFHKNLFKDITRILTVSKIDADRFKEFGCSELQIKAVGDTRFDRVHQKSLKAKDQHILKKDLFHGKKILVAGSTWYEDEDVLFAAFLKLIKYDKDVILIIAPHEPSLEHLERIENNFAGSLETIRFSYMNNYNKEKVIIVDSIGILLTLYSYADVAFVGGSFKQNVHNVLEAAVYGIPVLFGPKIETSQEAMELLRRGGGIMIRNKKEAYKQLRILTCNEELKKEKGEISCKYVEENLGATKKIMDEINEVIYHQ